MMTQVKRSDSDLISSYCKKGENRAFEELTRRYRDRLFSFIRSKVIDPELAEDIVQEAFIKVISELRKDKYNEEGKFFPWVMRICNNLTIDYFRSNKRKPHILRDQNDFKITDFIKDSDPDEEAIVVRKQNLKELESLIKDLPESQRKVLEMRCYEGLSFKEIASKTDVSINTALGRMRYAVNNLRKTIDQRKYSFYA